MPEFQRSIRLLGRRPTTQQFIDTIIKKYGTHLLISATLGGRSAPCHDFGSGKGGRAGCPGIQAELTLYHGLSFQCGYSHTRQIVSALAVISEQLILLSGAVSLDILLTSVEAGFASELAQFVVGNASFGYCISSFGNVV